MREILKKSYFFCNCRKKSVEKSEFAVYSISGIVENVRSTVMKKRRKSSFTLIEILAVIALLSVLISIFAPAFSRMMFGSKVDQMASNFKTGMEMAQAKAVATRKYVAMIIPNNYNAANTRLKPYCNGGYRLAFVKKDGDNWKFVSWVPGSNWTNIADGAMLVNLYSSQTLGGLHPDSCSCASTATNDDNCEIQKFYPEHSSSPDDVNESLLFSGSGSGRSSYLDKITDDTSDADMTDLGSDENRCGIIFGPMGGSFNSTAVLYFFFSEAKVEGSRYVYPNRDNFRALKLNALTGRVVHQSAEASYDEI